MKEDAVRLETGVREFIELNRQIEVNRGNVLTLLTE